jgi:ABC-2 type transport system permease protein
VANPFIRIGNLIVKELIQFGRDRLLATFILMAPALQLLLMAQAISRGITNQPVAILDLDRTAPSRELIVRMDHTDTLSVRFYVDSPEEMRTLLDQGRARLAVVIPAGFAEGLSRLDSPQQIQVLADATNTVAASLSINAAVGVVGRFSSDLAAGYGLVIPEFIDFRTDVRFNPTLDVRDFSIPAQLGFITYQVTLAVAALGLARERELGTLEQLMVTPLRRLELALGKGIPALGIGALNFALMLLIGRTVFDLPMNGSVGLLAALTLLFIAAVVCWGVAISAISRTQQQAILFVFIQAMVDVTFSGYLVRVRNMPNFLQFISRFVPLQHYLVIVRSIMLKGAGLDVLWPQVAALAGLTVAMGLIALRLVARRVE